MRRLKRIRSRKPSQNPAEYSGRTVQDKRSLIKLFPSMQIRRDREKHLLVTHFYGRRLKPSRELQPYMLRVLRDPMPSPIAPMDCSYCVLKDTSISILTFLYQLGWPSTRDQWFPFDRSPIPLSVGNRRALWQPALESIFSILAVPHSIFWRKRIMLPGTEDEVSECHPLLPLEHRGRTVVSWSLILPKMIAGEERKNGSMEERISAARKCQEKGILGISFWPTHLPWGWEEDIRRPSINFSRDRSRRVLWISLGGFSLSPWSSKRIAQGRFPKTEVFLGELFPGRDAKFR